MAALTPSTVDYADIGNMQMVIAKFSAITNADTYAAPMTTIRSVAYTPFVTTAVAHGAAWSGSTVTLYGTSAAGGVVQVIGF